MNGTADISAAPDWARQAFCLDFDGVLCHSAYETGTSAWRALARVTGECLPVEPPPDLLERFVRLRPVIETGYQCVPLMLLIREGVPEETILPDFDRLCDSVMRERGWSRERLVREFGAVRDDWIRTDFEDWLSRHRFYPGVVPRMQEACNGGAEMFVITTKQKRFAEALLRYAGIVLSEDHVFGLETGLPKPALISNLRDARDPAGERRWHFVEDRLPTLERAAAQDDLRDVHLYLASWGYVTGEAVARARRQKRVRVWTLDDFLIALGPPDPDSAS